MQSKRKTVFVTDDQMSICMGVLSFHKTVSIIENALCDLCEFLYFLLQTEKNERKTGKNDGKHFHNKFVFLVLN